MGLVAVVSAGLSLLSLLCHASVFAQSAPDQLLFGPQQYLRTSGAPNEYTDTFNVPASVGAPFQLHIVNGEADGSHRISSAWIKVNGVQVAGPNAFNQNVAVVDKTITLNPGSNTLYVKVASTSGSYLTISVFGTKILPTPASLTPNPLNLTVGATGTLTATLSPAPTTAGSLTVSSGNTSVATVPASVNFGVNQTGVPIPVTAVGAGQAQITVSLNGGTAGATVQVTPAPPTIASLLPPSLPLAQGSTGTLTVTISSAQSAVTTVSLNSSASGIASVPASVDVPIGAISASVPVSANTPGTAQITASLNGTSASSTVTVTPSLPTIAALVPPTMPMTLGAAGTLTITISASQPTDTVINVSASPNGMVTVPATVTVLAGQTSAPIPVGTVALGTAMVQVSLNGTTAEAAVPVVPPPPVVVSVTPSPVSVSVNATGQLTVTLTAAPLTNTDLAVTVNHATVLQAPASVTVPAGQVSAPFTVTGLATGNAVVTATLGSSSQQAAVQVVSSPPVPVSLLPNPLPLQQGATGTLTLTIDAAQPSDTVVPLTNSDTAIIQVLGSVTAPAGQTSATVPVTGLVPGTATVSATLNSATVSSAVEVATAQPVVTSLAPATQSLLKGRPGILRVTISRAAPDGVHVAVTSSAPGVAQAPAMVPVPAGALVADFPVLSLSEGTATVTATLNGGSATATVAVTPAEVVTLTLSPLDASIFQGESQQFTATGTFTDGTIQDLTTSVTWTSSNDTVATITASGVAAALTVGSTTITASITNPSGPPPVTVSTDFTVLTPAQLQVIPSTAGLQVGENISLTLDAGAPAGANGLTVTFTQSGSGSITHPATVTLLVGEMSAPFTVTGETAGSVTLTASATGRQSATATLTVTLGVPVITSFSPTSGQVGATVTLTGTSFDPTAANNVVKFNGVTAGVTSATGTTIMTTVPVGAPTGPITVTNAGGTGTSATPFTVVNSAPVFTPIGNQTVALGSTLTFTATATDPDLQDVAFAVTPAPLPAHAAFDVQTGVFTFAPDATQVGVFTFTFTATDGSATSSETITVTVTGAPPGGATALFGRVDDTSQHQLSGLPVTLKGTTLTTTTNAQGEFTLSSSTMPTGRQTLLVDGFAQGFAILAAPVDIIADVTNQVAQPFTLPPVDMSTAVTVNPNATTVLTSPTLNVTVTIPANTAKNADGTNYTGVLTISPVPEYGRVESRPVELRPGLSITIQPAGVVMATPVPITFPNVDNMAPGNDLDLWSLSPDTGTFIQVGTMRVSADGTKVETITGGVRKTAWHFAQAPQGLASAAKASDQVAQCPECTVASGADLEEGALTQDVTIPGIRTLGVSRDLRLHYRSTSADVRPILPVNAFLDVRAAVPQTFSARLTVGGIQQGGEVYWNSSGLPESTSSTSRLGIQFDASSLATGRYAYELMLFSNYPQSSIGGGSNSQTLIRNERTSPFGAGWTLAGLDRLIPQPGGTVLVLASGEGGTEMFTQSGRPLVIESFDLARSDGSNGQNASFVIGGAYTQARADLTAPANFGANGIVPRSVTFRSGINTITTQALAGADIFVLNRTAANVPNVTSQEATALEEFVQNGGAVLEIRDFGGNRPLLLGTLPGAFTCDQQAILTVEGLNSVLANGPFGSVAGPILTGCHAAFASNGLGIEIARQGTVTGPPDILQLQPNTLFTEQGRAVLIGDEEIFASGFAGGLGNRYGGQNRTLFLNIMTYLAGTPGYLPPPPTGSSQYVGPAGDFSTLVRNADGTYTRTLKDGTKFQFDAQGFQTAVTDRNNNTTTYAYDAQNKLTTITDPAGQVTTFAYSGSVLTSVTDPAGRITHLAHDSDGNLTGVTYADTSQQTFEYDPQRRMTKRTDAQNKVSQYQYDYAGRFTQATLPTGETRKLTPSQRIAVPNTAAGEGTITNPAPLSTSTVHAASFTDAADHTTAFEHDAQGRITKQTDALNRTTNITRDAQGNPTSITRPNGAVTTMTYDAKGNLLTTTEQAIAATTTFTYEPTFNQVASITDPLNHQTTITYDATGNPLTITDADNKVTTFTYDSRGLLLTSKDALNQTTTFTYDTQGRLLTTTDPLNRTTTLTYDGAGNVATSTDALSRVTTFTYDAFNRLKTVTDPATGVTTYTYDGNGNLLTVKDAKNQTTTFVYDSRNRLASTTDPLGKTESYIYDGNDNLLTRLTPNNATISFTYDAVNQLLSKTLPGSLVTSYTYDLVGNLTGVTDPDSQLTMTYDLANRLTSVATTGSPNQPAVTLSYTYDKTGNRLTLGDGTGTNTYVYDVLNRLANLASPAGTVTYAYDALSRRTSATLPNGTTTTYTYDVASQVTNILHQITASSTQINKADYVYNNVGNRTSLTDRRGAQAFGYDQLDRLTSASHPLLGTPQAFAYDPVGNLTTGGSQHNAGNQLTADASFSYQYDDNGNLTRKTITANGNYTQYTYDAENRLVKVEEFTFGNPTPVATSTYRYDGLGRRIEKVGNGQTRRYIYDGEDVLLEYDQTNTLLARYTHGPGIDEPIAMTRSGSTFFYHQDGLGTVTELTDATGATSKTYSYDAYGNILESPGTVENPYTYTGREFDAETGLYYYRARHYEAATGRFLQKDPIGFGAGTNVYLYVKDNPVKYIDPTGLYQWYGNYGGPDWTGGQKEPYDPAHEKRYLPPKDSQDACYRDHDICYYKCRQASCDCGQLKACFTGCDRALSRCLRNLETLHDPSYDAAAKRAAEYFEIRNPGCR